VDDAAPAFESQITELLAVARTGDREAVRATLAEVVPGYDLVVPKSTSQEISVPVLARTSETPDTDTAIM
jgi:hypothetical protein